MACVHKIIILNKFGMWLLLWIPSLLFPYLMNFCLVNNLHSCKKFLAFQNLSVIWCNYGQNHNLCYCFCLLETVSTQPSSVSGVTWKRHWSHATCSTVKSQNSQILMLWILNICSHSFSCHFFNLLWLCQIGTRTRGCQVAFLHCPPVVQTALNSVKLSENYWYHKTKLLKLTENIKSINLSLCFSPHCILSKQVC